MKEYHKTTLKQQQQELKQVKSALGKNRKRSYQYHIETIATTGFTSDTLTDKLKQLEQSKSTAKEHIAELENYQEHQY